MSVPDLEPSLAALLRAEREGVRMPADAKDALWARLETSVALSSPGHPTSPRPPTSPVAHPGGGLGAAGFVKANALWIVLSGLGVATGLAALGVVGLPSGSAPASSIEPGPPPSSTTAFESTTAAPAPSETASDAASAESAPVLPAPVPSAPHAILARPPSDDDLGRERALIEAARAAIRAGAPARGIDKLDEHARAFPRGRMSEERDALRVLALRSSGHDAEATSATEAFRTRYPHSLLLGNR